VRYKVRQVENKPGPPVRFHNRQALGISIAKVVIPVRQTTLNLTQIQRDTRRIFNGVPRRFGWFTIKSQNNLGPVPGKL